MANGNGNGTTTVITHPDAPKESFTIQNTLAVLVVVSFVGVIVSWMYFPPTGDVASVTVLNTLIGVLGTAFVTVVQFHFGSSRGSSEKDATISRMATTSGTGTGTVAVDGVGAAEKDAEAAWAILKTSNDPIALRKFVADFPGSQHKQEAEAIIAKLNSPP